MHAGTWRLYKAIQRKGVQWICWFPLFIFSNLIASNFETWTLKISNFCPLLKNQGWMKIKWILFSLCSTFCWCKTFVYEATYHQGVTWPPNNVTWFDNDTCLGQDTCSVASQKSWASSSIKIGLEFQESWVSQKVERWLIRFTGVLHELITIDTWHNRIKILLKPFQLMIASIYISSHQ